MKNNYIHIFYCFLFFFQSVSAETNLNHKMKKMDQGGYFDSKNSGALPQVPEKNPLSTYCGKDCINCGFSKTQCLGVFRQYFSTLCQNQNTRDIETNFEKKDKGLGIKALETMQPDQNCFLIWQQYAETCSRLCKNS